MPERDTTVDLAGPVEAGSGRDAPRVLIADDQIDVLESLRLLLKGEGYRTESATSPDAVVLQVQSEDFDVALVDLNYARDTTSGKEGLDLLRRIRNVDGTLPVVVMTAWGSIELAVQAMRLGARDFIEKPWDNNRLLSILRTQIELGRALRRSRLLEAENRVLRQDGPPELVAASAAMQPVMEIVARVGPSDANVLITGESGCGKGVVAHALHRVSERARRPLVSLNVGGLSGALFESELFGHVKGAFTDARIDRVGRFELAQGGTLFLDEIANISPAQQAKLLRVLETGELERVGSSRTRRVDVRILSATNADLQQEIAGGRFRQDLLYRLNTIEIPVPPLRRRQEDIPVLAGLFLQRYAGRYRRRVEGFSPDASQALLAHDWPGNVRELDHAVQRAVLMARGARVEAADLALGAREQGPRLDEMRLDEVERHLIRAALSRHGGNVSEAAKSLGLSRSALYRRLQRYGL